MGGRAAGGEERQGSGGDFGRTGAIGGGRSGGGGASFDKELDDEIPF